MKKFSINAGKNDLRNIITSKNGCPLSIDKYYRELPKFIFLNQKKEKELLTRIQQGDKKAEQELFFTHARFVISVAKKMYAERRDENRVASLNDFVQWGNMGLIKAMYAHDITKENRFLSYAVYWITGIMLDEYHRYAHTVYLPANQRKIIQKFRKYESGEDLLLEVYSGNEDVEYGIGFDFLSKHTKAALLIPRHYHALHDSVSIFISTDDLMPVEISTDSILYSEDEADKSLANESLCYELARALSTLTEREAQILVLFFGITPLYQGVLGLMTSGDDERERYYQAHHPTEMNLEEIGVLFNVLPERVRQIKDKALQRLRHTSRSKLLIEYLC